jgi:DNA (cytosine-5)-methyltransferase 1
MKVGTDFSGIGAPEQALSLLGVNFETLFACEIDKYARESYKAIHPEPKTFYNDITKRDHSEIPQLDLYFAGFPCQSFSIAGKRAGWSTGEDGELIDSRGNLFFDVAKFIKINQPKMFILENVKGLLSHDNGRTYQTITDILTNGGGTLNGQISLDVFEDGLGYHCFAQTLNTKDFGIPQNRERIFIVGFKEFRDFSFPKKEPLHLRLKDMLQDNPNTKYYLSDKAIKKIQKHENPIFKNTPQQVSGCIHAGYYKMGGRDQQYIKLIKSERIRRLTPLECWRLQAFPDEQFLKAEKVCSDTQLYKQAGNSISCNVLVKLLEKILE